MSTWLSSPKKAKQRSIKYQQVISNLGTFRFIAGNFDLSLFMSDFIRDWSKESIKTCVIRLNFECRMYYLYMYNVYRVVGIYGYFVRK